MKMPSTPPKELAERRKVASEAVEKIRESEALYAKAIDVVATIWGALLEYDTAMKIRQSVREADECISAIKREIWKIPLQQKVNKNAEIKSLQQEF